MHTRFEQHNQDFSDKAHAAAQSLVYPRIFKCDENMLSFDSASVSDGGEKAILDGQMAVDRLIEVTVAGLRHPIQHTVQERFRRPGYRNFRDITITEWNHASNQPSELYKIKCGIFTYGYYYEEEKRFGDVIAVDVSAFLMAMTVGGIEYTKRTNQKKQDFICVTFDELHRAGVVLAQINEAKQEPVLQAAWHEEFF